MSHANVSAGLITIKNDTKFKILCQFIKSKTHLLVIVGFKIKKTIITQLKSKISNIYL
jgi:hypothetical protein